MFQKVNSRAYRWLDRSDELEMFLAASTYPAIYYLTLSPTVLP